ncbi:hypothetical protein ACUTGZ_27640, partial [Klebsiella pneumoniae]|uniref:hypothetical protein n=1 Tax=Klebsiella pneumoniae TaxID=573 RepID=UPI00404521C1
VIALAQGGGEDASAGEGKGGVEKQAEYHLAAVGVAAGKGAAGAELALHFFDEAGSEGDVVHVFRAGGDWQDAAAIVEMAVDAVGVD